MKTLLALLVTAFTAQAQLIEDFSGESNVSTGPGTSGIQFVANESLTLRSVGIYDWDAETPGLYSSHAIGLWDAVTHELLASATVPQQGAVAIGDWWYVALAAPITLQSGHSYVLAAQYEDNSFDFSAANASSVTTDSRITLVDALLSSGTGFSFPDISVPGASYGFFGPNAMEAVVPEPASMAIVTAILLALFAFANTLRASEPPVTIRSILDAKPAERQRLLTKLAKTRPATAKMLAPASNRPPVTPGNTNGRRPTVPPGLKNYATP